MRCMVLAEAINIVTGSPVAFVVSHSAEGYISELSRFDCLVLDNAESEITQILKRWPDGAGLLVVDHYSRDCRFEAACRPWAKKILVIDDLADRKHDCEWLLDVTCEQSGLDYEGLVPQVCQRMVGPDFALVRPDFRARRSAALARRESAQIRRILVNFGTLPAMEQVIVALAGIARARVQPEMIDVVLGHYDDSTYQGVSEFARRAGLPVNLNLSVDDMPERMFLADMAIGAAGVSSWERCVLGLPAITMVCFDNQRKVDRALSDAGATVSLGAAAGVMTDAVAEAISLLSQDDAYRRISHNAALLCDGLGANRVVSALWDIRAKDGASVNLRPIRETDSDRILAWQRIPGVRRYFHNTEAPTREEHKAWFSERLNASCEVNNIVVYNNQPMGYLRLQPSGESAYEVSIIIAPDKAGCGVATAALRCAQVLMQGSVLVAEVNDENKGSIRAFLSAGFQREDDRLFRTNPKR